MFHPFSPGAAFWTERGTSMINSLHAYLREMQRDGYQEIKTPLLFNKGLWEISGHWGKYRENMFLVLDNETGEHDLSLKPMNCPSHHLYLRVEEAFVPRSAAALHTPTMCCIATSCPARCPASRVCGSSSRTIATST